MTRISVICCSFLPCLRQISVICCFSFCSKLTVTSPLPFWARCFRKSPPAQRSLQSLKETQRSLQSLKKTRATFLTISEGNLHNVPYSLWRKPAKRSLQSLKETRTTFRTVCRKPAQRSVQSLKETRTTFRTVSEGNPHNAPYSLWRKPAQRFVQSLKETRTTFRTVSEGNPHNVAYSLWRKPTQRSLQSLNETCTHIGKWRPRFQQSRVWRWKPGMTAMGLGDCLLLILHTPCHFSPRLQYIFTSLFWLFSHFGRLVRLLCVNWLFSFALTAAVFLSWCYCYCVLTANELSMLKKLRVRPVINTQLSDDTQSLKIRRREENKSTKRRKVDEERLNGLFL